MSYQEKRTILSVTIGVLLLVAYCIYAFGSAGATQVDDLKFWATTMLVFIGIGIVAMIVIQIVFHILLSISLAVKQKMIDESCDDKEIEKSIQREMVEDEMDKLIELKASRIGLSFAGFGFVAGLIALGLDASVVVMLNILFISYSVGTVIEGLTQLYFYRKGV